jgi:hypothetical protein
MTDEKIIPTTLDEEVEAFVKAALGAQYLGAPAPLMIHYLEAAKRAAKRRDDPVKAREELDLADTRPAGLVRHGREKETGNENVKAEAFFGKENRQEETGKERGDCEPATPGGSTGVHCRGL